MSKEEQKKVCDVCGGVGQVSFFKGASRFLLSTEECQECAGTGYQIDSIKNKTSSSNAVEKKKRKNVKKA